ncbi:hypothetical protein Moror_3597 [Moniliophthora roreri MCA 2997]|uniref:DUF4939 domain-containing protein n=2 Tax=Moniliophthora roreri TaxID=221103 RepID=V2Y0I4_MONRO|nr:hypothetical protein Moror_3597 [Moniliophthora roreri MCA 2997]
MKEESSIPDISSGSPIKADPFQTLLKTLKNSSRSGTPKLDMSEGKKPARSKLKPEPEPEEAVIESTVQPFKDKKIKAALPTPFTGDRKDTEKFMLKVQLYVTLNPKAFKNNKLKALFMLSYIQGGTAQFWKADKTKILLAEEDPAKIPKWKDFLKGFKKSFRSLNVELDAQMKL